MNHYTELRNNQRSANLIGRVALSEDRRYWVDVDLCDLSASGLRFTSEREYDDSRVFYFDLVIYNVLSEFNLKFEGRLVKAHKVNDQWTYAVKFHNMNRYDHIQLDELIQSRISGSNLSEHTPEDGIYSFLFNPRTRSSKYGMIR